MFSSWPALVFHNPPSVLRSRCRSSMDIPRLLHSSGPLPLTSEHPLPYFRYSGRTCLCLVQGYDMGCVCMCEVGGICWGSIQSVLEYTLLTNLGKVLKRQGAWPGAWGWVHSLLGTWGMTYQMQTLQWVGRQRPLGMQQGRFLFLFTSAAVLFL